MTLSNPGRTVGVAAVAAAVVLGPGAVSAQAAEVDLAARMHATAAFPHARGHAEYEAEGSHRELEISLAGLRALHGKRVVVRVHGTFVGGARVSKHGRVHLDRHTTVAMSAGDAIRVRTGGGKLVARGTFHRDTD